MSPARANPLKTLPEAGFRRSSERSSLKEDRCGCSLWKMKNAWLNSSGRASRRRAMWYQGSISVESAVDRGSLFRVDLPLEGQ
jgi:hypothetical protein